MLVCYLWFRATMKKIILKKRLENILQELINENKTANIKEEMLEKMLG